MDASLTVPAANRAAKRILDGVNASGRVFISSTRIDGRTALRACILTHRTDAARVAEAAALITTHARRWLPAARTQLRSSPARRPA